jgi:hypothetical protein
MSAPDPATTIRQLHHSLLVGAFVAGLLFGLVLAHL